MPHAHDVIVSREMMRLILAGPCTLLYSVSDRSSWGRLQIFQLIVEFRANPSLPFFPTKEQAGILFGPKPNENVN